MQYILKYPPKMCLYRAIIKMSFLNVKKFKWIGFITNKFDLNQIHLECYIRKLVKCWGAGRGWLLWLNWHFTRKMAVCFVGLHGLWVLSPAAGALRGLWHTQPISDSQALVRWLLKGTGPFCLFILNVENGLYGPNPFNPHWEGKEEFDPIA